MTVTGSVILDTGKTPAEWCDIMAQKGLAISERSLRTKARGLGACHIIGKAMLITPEQIDRIFDERPCYPSPAREVRIRRSTGSNLTSYRPPATFEAARAHLERAREKLR